MTVETLLEQLKRERMDAMTSAWIYSSKAQQAKNYGDYVMAEIHQRNRDENYKKDVLLSMIIREIEERVS